MIKLYKHQKNALRKLENNNSFLLSMEQGTGKTLPSLFHIDNLMREGRVNTALVVCPKSVIGSWQRDILKLDRETQKRLENLEIINYDSVWRRGKLKNNQYDLILLDECHNITNPKAQRTKFILLLSLKAKYRYLLSGTPVGNGRLEDCWSLLTFMFPIRCRHSVGCQLLHDDKNTGTYYNFLERFCYLDEFFKPYRYRNIRQIQNLVFRYSYRVEKINCLDLPAKLPDEVRTVEMSNQLKPLYNEMARTSCISGKNILAENPLTKLSYLRQLCSGYIDESPVKNNKIPALEEILEENGEKPLVIFAHYRRSINEICGLLTRLNISHVRLDGTTKNKNVWRDFQNGTSQVIVCQYETASAGVDLYRASTTVYFEPTLRSTTLEQSRDRTHRHGQKEPCSYIHLLTTGTVETAIYSTVLNYQDFSKKLFAEYLDECERRKRRGR